MADVMADVDKSGSGNGGDRDVYDGFLGITKWAVILIALVLILMAIFLV